MPVTDFPAGAFTALALNYLVEWITKGTAPPHAPPIAVDQNTANDGSHLALDELRQRQGRHSQRLGGRADRDQRRVRQGQDDAQDRLCQLAGTKVPLAEATLKKLYPTTGVYAKKAEQRLSELIAQGWFLPEYADMVRRDVHATRLP